MRPEPRLLPALAALLALAASGCAARTGPDTGAPKHLRVGVVFDVGGRGDGGFNDQAAIGAQRVAVANPAVAVELAESRTETDQAAAMRRFAASHADLVIGVGFLASESATKLAREYPGVRFAVVDYALPVDEQGRAVLPPPNLAAVTFHEEEGSYLAGAAAAMASRSHTVGFVGGMKGALIGKFEAGYEAGVRRVCPTCRVLVQYLSATPAGFNDAAGAERAAGAMYDAGADVIFHAAGESGEGVFRAARAQGALAEGVDVDQGARAPGHVLTSMIKRIDVAVADVITRSAAGRFRGGVNSFGLAEDGVGYVYDSTTARHLTAEQHTRLEVLRGTIVAGLVKVPTAR